MHDGMSLVKGTGRGCYATFATLTSEIGCDASNLSKSLRRLIEWGYLSEERQEDRRRKTYRVIFYPADCWRNDQQPFVGETANNQPEIVGNCDSGNGGNPLLNGQHYSSLKGLDPLEREKLNSPEGARFTARGSPEKTPIEENVGAQLAILERALNAGDDINLVDWYEYVGSVWEEEEHRGHAMRLAEKLAERMTTEEWEQCAL